MLIVGNWRYCQDQNKSPLNIRTCQPDDFSIRLKLASTTFRNPSNPDKVYYFDKNGIQIPFGAFTHLLSKDNTAFQAFLGEIRHEFQKDSPHNQALLNGGADLGTLEGEAVLGSELDEEDEHRLNAVLGHPPAPPLVSGSGGGKKRKGESSSSNKKQPK